MGPRAEGLGWLVGDRFALVKDWHRHLNSNAGRTAIEEFEIPMVAGENRISAVAFNQDGIQSQESTWNLSQDKVLTINFEAHFSATT